MLLVPVCEGFVNRRNHPLSSSFSSSFLAGFFAITSFLVQHPAMASAPTSSHYVGLRLRALIWSCLDCDLVSSAVFFAERYYHIDPDNHQARHLYASSLLRAGQVHSALFRVQDQSCLGCLEVYSRCCNALGRHRDSEEALKRCLEKGEESIASGTFIDSSLCLT